MKMYGKAQETAERIIEQFQSGNVPEALSKVFIKRDGNSPCELWSWNNQFVTALNMTRDARGFKQWQEVGRKVKKGAKSFHILGPLTKTFTKKDEEAGEEKKLKVIYGFKSIPVFRFEDTEVFDEDLWQKAHTPDESTQKFLDLLPFKEVAEKWGIEISIYKGQRGRYLGFYQAGIQDKVIALGVENMATWAHEMVHAADHICGNLRLGTKQDQTNEIVAELGGATLLLLTGHQVEADLGGAWKYITSYADGDKNKAIKLSMELIDRTATAVDCILKEYEKTKDQAQTCDQEAA